MIEELLFAELNTRLRFPIYPTVPENMPERFYVLQKTGSRLEDQIKESTIAIQSYGKNVFEAASMNEDLKSVMLSLNELDEISAVDLNGDYNYTDTQTKRNRYQAVFVITHY